MTRQRWSYWCVTSWAVRAVLDMRTNARSDGPFLPDDSKCSVWSGSFCLSLYFSPRCFPSLPNPSWPELSWGELNCIVLRPLWALWLLEPPLRSKSLILMPVIICVDSHRSNWKNNHEPHRLPLLLVRSETVSFYPIPATPSAQFVGPCPHTLVSGALFLSVLQRFLSLNSSRIHFAAVLVFILQLLFVIHIYTVSSLHVLQVSLQRFLVMSSGSEVCLESIAPERFSCRANPQKLQTTPGEEGDLCCDCFRKKRSMRFKCISRWYLQYFFPWAHL